MAYEKYITEQKAIYGKDFNKKRKEKEVSTVPLKQITETEIEKVKALELWEQQNTNTELNFYAANLTAKIRSTVTKQETNSPRLHQHNLGLIQKDPFGKPLAVFDEEKMKKKGNKEIKVHEL